MNTFQITIQRKSGDSWPVVVEESKGGVFLPVRKEGLLKIEEAKPLAQPTPRDYGTVLGEALFQGNVLIAFVQALRESEGSVRVLLFIEAPDLRTWRWKRLGTARWHLGLPCSQPADALLPLPSQPHGSAFSAYWAARLAGPGADRQSGGSGPIRP